MQLIDDLKDKASAHIAHSETAQRIIVAAESGPQVSLSFAAIALCVALLIAPVWGWHVGRKYDATWRDKIAASSAGVRAAIKAGNREAEITDDDIIKALGDSDEKQRDAETKLKAAGLDDPASDGCPVIPDRCIADPRQPGRLRQR